MKSVSKIWYTNFSPTDNLMRDWGYTVDDDNIESIIIEWDGINRQTATIRYSNQSKRVVINLSNVIEWGYID